MTTINEPLELDPSYAPLIFPESDVAEAARRQERSIEVRPGENSLSVEFEQELDRRSIECQVIDKASGRPIPGARCRVFASEMLTDGTLPTSRPIRYGFGFAPEASTLANKQAVSGVDGLARLGSLPVGSYICTVRARGFARARREFVHSLESPVSPVRVELDRGAEMRGVVVGPGDDPEPNAWVAVLPSVMDEPFLPRANIFHFLDDPPVTMTDAQGRFRLSGLDNAPVTILGWSGTHAPVALDASAPMDGIVVRLADRLARLKVRVTRSGSTVRSASVDFDYVATRLSIPPAVWDIDAFFQSVGNWMRQPKFSGPDGVAEFDRVLPAEKWIVRVRDGKPTTEGAYVTRTLRIVPGETVDLTVDLESKDR
jgi:hypothetical protein